jgi:hypothetical protein
MAQVSLKGSTLVVSTLIRFLEKPLGLFLNSRRDGTQIGLHGTPWLQVFTRTVRGSRKCGIILSNCCDRHMTTRWSIFRWRRRWSDSMQDAHNYLFKKYKVCPVSSVSVDSGSMLMKPANFIRDAHRRIRTYLS